MKKSTKKNTSQSHQCKTEILNKHGYEAIVIGVSAGGMGALSAILPELPADLPYPVIIVQHMYPGSGSYLVSILDGKSQITVKEVEEKDKIAPGTVYIAPPNYHTLVEMDRTFSLSIDPPVNYARPSIDVLFESAADVYRNRLIGIILTGANSDGSRGLRRIKEIGGIAIVQDPATAEMDSMPNAAIAAAEPDYILPLDQIGTFIGQLAMNNNLPIANC